MNIVIAVDSYKDCLSSALVATHLKNGILKVYPDARIVEIPIADGGEGTLDAMAVALGAEKIFTDVHDPLMRPISAPFGFSADRKIAIIEMAAASGLERLNSNERNPMKTTTYGTGELIKAALDRGAKEIVLGIGGSATNDAGAGMAVALGAKLTDAMGNPLHPVGGELYKLKRIDLSDMHPGLKQVKIKVACDVSNLLTGENGASKIFGPQKGATNAMVNALDENLKHFASIVKSDLNINLLNLEGGGAAGGLGAGLYLFTGAELVPGFELISETVKLKDHIKNADFVLTGEGKLDGQTLNGKTPFGVAQLAKKHNKTVVAIAGQLGEGYQNLYPYGFDSIFTISDGKGDLEDAIKRAPELLESTSERIFRLIKSVS